MKTKSTGYTISDPTGSIKLKRWYYDIIKDRSEKSGRRVNREFIDILEASLTEEEKTKLKEYEEMYTELKLKI